MGKDLPWMSIFIHVLGAADTDAAADEVSAEVLGLAAGHREAVEAARIRLISAVTGESLMHRDARALGYLDIALRRGDEANRWHRHPIDPWSVTLL
jgi:hypothetical protein